MSQLKKRGKIFEFTSSKLDLSSDSTFSNSTVPPKALQLLGVQQEEAIGQQLPNSRSQTPLPAQRFPSGRANEVPVSARPSPSLQQADLSAAVAGIPINEQVSSPQTPELEVQRCDIAKAYPVLQESAKPNLQPPNIAIFGVEGKQFGAIRQQILHPSKSFQAIIETASPTSPETHGIPRLEQHVTPTKRLQHEPSGEVLHPAVYSPDNYNGVWENDPAVVSNYMCNLDGMGSHISQGYTLPPFSPMPKMGHPDHHHVPQKLTATSNTVFPIPYRERFPRNPSAVYGNQHQDNQDGSMRNFSRTASEDQPNESLRPQRSQSFRDPTKTDIQPQLNREILSREPSKGHGSRPQHQHPNEYGQYGLQKAIIDSRTHSVFPPPTPSNNSWATSSTPGPPQWPVLQLNNPVPSPPYSQQDYTRPSPLSAGLAQLDMTLHHHIDSIFNSLSRQITDKHDRVLDRVLIRIDNLEDKLCKELKGMKSEMNSMKKEVEKLRTSAVSKPQGLDTIVDALQTFGSKIDALEGHVDDIKCKGHIQFADMSNNEATNGQRQRYHPIPHHTRSNQGSLDGSQSSPGGRQYRLQHRNGTISRSPSKSRHSGNSNGSEMKGPPRSRGASVSGWQADEVRMEVNQALGREKVGGPDLRDHPAYQQQKDGGQMNKGLMMDGEALSKQNLGEEGWYQLAYGKRFEKPQ